MDVLVDILIGLALLVVTGSLGLGLLAMARGEGARSNKMMRWRVWSQAGAVGVLVLSLLYKAGR